MGYNVLLSDVDVYWFHNPVQFLHSLGPATFAAQSDEYNETGDFYLLVVMVTNLVLLMLLLLVDNSVFIFNSMC